MGNEHKEFRQYGYIKGKGAPIVAVGSSEYEKTISIEVILGFVKLEEDNPKLVSREFWRTDTKSTKSEANEYFSFEEAVEYGFSFIEMVLSERFAKANVPLIFQAYDEGANVKSLLFSAEGFSEFKDEINQMLRMDDLLNGENVPNFKFSKKI